MARRSPERDVIEVIEEFQNIGPITDFCIADLDKQVTQKKKKDRNTRKENNGFGFFSSSKKK